MRRPMTALQPTSTGAGADEHAQRAEPGVAKTAQPGHICHGAPGRRPRGCSRHPEPGSVSVPMAVNLGHWLPPDDGRTR